MFRANEGVKMTSRDSKKKRRMHTHIYTYKNTTEAGAQKKIIFYLDIKI